MNHKHPPLGEIYRKKKDENQNSESGGNWGQAKNWVKTMVNGGL